MSGWCLGPLCWAFSSAPELAPEPLPPPVAILEQLAECLLWKCALSVVAELSQCATPRRPAVASISGFWHCRGFKDQRRQRNNALVPSDAVGGVAISLLDGLSCPGLRRPRCKAQAVGEGVLHRGLCETRAGQTGAAEGAKRSRGRAHSVRIGLRETECSRGDCHPL